MTTSKKPEPGGSAPVPARSGDDCPSRLFDKQERDAVYQAIFDMHDGPRAPPGRRTELARGLRDLLAAPVADYAGALQAGGLTAPELPSALRLLSELHRVSDALEAAEGGHLTGDESSALAVGIDAAWSTFIGDASAREVQAEKRLRQDAVAKATPFIEHQGRRKEPLAKTKLYEKFAALYPGDNVMAVEALRKACPKPDDGKSPFYWVDFILWERKTGKPIKHTTMKAQLQKARQAMKSR